MNLDYLKSIIENPVTSIWLSNANAEGETEIVRTTLARIDVASKEILMFAPLNYCHNLIENFNVTKNMAFAGCKIDNYETYQIKGQLIEFKACTDESDIQAQMDNIKAISNFFVRFGIEADNVFNSYFGTPSIQIRMGIDEIFEQTPKTGTGSQLIME